MLRLSRLALRSRSSGAPRITSVEAGEPNAVDAFWGETTVKADDFRTARASLQNLEWRFDQYPLFREFSGLWGKHDDEVILDYGCGPGNDLTGFAVHTGARRLIGIDVSEHALELARRRLALHGVGEDRVELILSADSETTIPLDHASVDHFNSQGVIHHTTDPEAILRELSRVLKPGGTGCIMVYNRASIWFHLFTAFDTMIVANAFPGLPIDEVFKRTTDGEECPISRAYDPDDFVEMCVRAGLEAEFVGGYLSLTELEGLKTSWPRAIADQRLDRAHRSFLRELTYDARGHPMHRGRHAGLGGTYRLRKPAQAVASA